MNESIKLALGDYYSEADYNDMVGCLLMIFSKNELVNHISRVENGIIKQGFGGNLGNKGAINIILKLYDSICCFICVHLPAG
jgi:hypothetical protein